MAKIREGFIRIAIITINSASRWREAAPLQIRPVNWQQVSIRFQAVRDFLGHWVIQPQFLQLAISIRTKIKRITPPVKKENWPKLLTTEQIWRKVSSDSRVSWEGLTLNLELFFSRTFRLGTICSSLSITLLDLFSITSYGRIRREELRKLDHYFDLFLAPLRSHWIWTCSKSNDANYQLFQPLRLFGRLQCGGHPTPLSIKADLHGTTLSHTTSLRQAYDMNCFL